MEKRAILSAEQIDLTVKRLCFQLLERHKNLSNTVLIGLQPRGVHFARRVAETLALLSGESIAYGELDVTFYRDDFRRGDGHLKANPTRIDFLIEDKKVVLIDDVLFTGRTIRAGFDALLHYGRPASVELMVLIERSWSRQFPIEADYLGKSTNTLKSQKVKVEWAGVDADSDQVLLITQ